MFDWVCMNINNLIKGEFVKTKFILNSVGDRARQNRFKVTCLNITEEDP